MMHAGRLKALAARKFGSALFCAAGIMALCGVAACNTVDDNRIPSLPVNINLSTADMWVTYGVSGYGEYRTFVRSLREPRNFPYTDVTATGFGGVLLISGVNPYTLEAGVPLAYDLSCPVECKSDIRVAIVYDDAIPVAVCHECGSTYDVVELGGSPTDGPAKQRRLGMRRYECRETGYGGYLILNK